MVTSTDRGAEPLGESDAIYFTAPQSLYDETVTDEDGTRCTGGGRHSTLYVGLQESADGLVVSLETAFAAATAASRRFGDEGYATRWEVNRQERWIRYHQTDVPGSEPIQLTAADDGTFVLPANEFQRAGEHHLEIADSITNVQGVRESVPAHPGIKLEPAEPESPAAAEDPGWRPWRQHRQELLQQTIEALGGQTTVDQILLDRQRGRPTDPREAFRTLESHRQRVRLHADQSGHRHDIAPDAHEQDPDQGVETAF